MEQINDKSQVAIIDSNRLSQYEISSFSITHFEDLSNELIYEIFEYFDFCHAYEIFFNLNTRFRSLLINSTLPIKIKLSFLSKATFEYYDKNIIIPYQQQIQSLQLSNPFIIDSFSLIPKLIQLRTLIIENIQSKYLENLLNDLFVLPHLSSLVIICNSYVPNRNTVYQQIFRLSALKYCKLSIHAPYPPEQLSIATNQFSPIVHLVIKDSINLNELSCLLSHVPQLHRLSIDNQVQYYNRQRNVWSNVSANLTHVYLNLEDVYFDKFEPLIKNLFRQLQILSILTSADRSYLDANRWKQLILSHMPYLRIFDIHYCEHTNMIDKEMYAVRFDQFESSFWFERQWFFAYHIPVKSGYVLFYSAPYRKRQFKLASELIKRSAPYTKQTYMNSVHHLELEDGNERLNSTNYFPNVTQLSFKYNPLEQNTYLSPVTLNQIVPLNKITKLDIHCFHLYFKHIIELLTFTPNVRILRFNLESNDNTDLRLIKQNQSFKMVSATNKIEYVQFGCTCTFERIELLVNIFPRLKHLSMTRPRDPIENILQFLLSKNNDKTRYLHSLWIGSIRQRIFQNVMTVLRSQSEKLLVDCAMDGDGCIRLWW